MNDIPLCGIIVLSNNFKIAAVSGSHSVLVPWDPSARVADGAMDFGQSRKDESRFPEMDSCSIHCSTTLLATNKIEYRCGEEARMWSTIIFGDE